MLFPVFFDGFFLPGLDLCFCISLEDDSFVDEGFKVVGLIDLEKFLFIVVFRDIMEETGLLVASFWIIVEFEGNVEYSFGV